MLVFFLPPPFHSSEGAEYWAVSLLLRWLTSLHSGLQCVIFGDSDQLIRTIDAQPHTMASQSSHGTWIKTFCSLVAQLPSCIHAQFAWIKGHTGVQRQWVLFSKLIACSSSPPQSSCSPLPIGIISSGVLPVCHHVTTSIFRSLIPRHYHHNLHVSSSFYYYNPSSWFCGLPFQLSSGNTKFSTYTYHDDYTPHACHKCSHPHPPDVISFVFHCPCADHIICNFIQAWPSPFNQIASVWWSACPRLGDKRSFAKMLVFSSVYEAMTTPAQEESNHQRVVAFKNILSQRQRKLEGWLKTPPSPPPPPPEGASTWEKPNSTTAPRTRHLCSPLPVTITRQRDTPTLLKPSRRRNPGDTKTKSPCVPAPHKEAKGRSQ